jgi:hypothetical protein
MVEKEYGRLSQAIGAVGQRDSARGRELIIRGS